MVKGVFETLLTVILSISVKVDHVKLRGEIKK